MVITRRKAIPPNAAAAATTGAHKNHQDGSAIRSVLPVVIAKPQSYFAKYVSSEIGTVHYNRVMSKIASPRSMTCFIHVKFY